MTSRDLEILAMLGLDVADNEQLPALIEVAHRRLELQDWLDHIALSTTPPPPSVCKLLAVPKDASMRECADVIRRHHAKTLS